MLWGEIYNIFVIAMHKEWYPAMFWKGTEMPFSIFQVYDKKET